MSISRTIFIIYGRKKNYKEAFKSEITGVEIVPKSAIRKIQNDKDIAISAIRDSGTFTHEKCKLIQLILSNSLDENKLQDILQCETQDHISKK